VHADTVRYRVDGEVGRFEFTTHWIEDQECCVYNTAQQVFPRRIGKEWYKTSGFKELAMLSGATAESYRKAGDYLNRFRYQQTDGTPSRTLREQTTIEGDKLSQAIQRKAQMILTVHDFTAEAQFIGLADTYADLCCETLPPSQVAEAIATCQARCPVTTPLSDNPVPYEAPDATVEMCIDDVGAKQQKARRRPAEKPPPEMKKSRQYVHTTVVSFRHAQQRYTLTGHGLTAVLQVVIAFLLHNHLLGTRFQFFTDGYPILLEAIGRSFSWYSNLGIILDWYHLKEKCKVQLSLAMTGRTVRNETLKHLLPLLWYGCVDDALASLKQLQPDTIKNAEAVDRLVKYLRRNRPYIPCYAVRKELGLRNSSQLGEKMNDLVVSTRQKHNGMSWSVSGSTALAALTALGRNQEHARWFNEGKIDFKLAA